MSRNRCTVALVLSLALCACGVASLGAAPRGDVLRRVYTEGPPEKRALLTECRHRLERIRARAGGAQTAPDWGTDPDVRWLLANRAAATLAVEPELQGQPEGRYLEALLYLTRALGSRRLVRCLPGLLERSLTSEARLLVLRTMATVGDSRCMEALEAYLETAEWNTPDALLCAAAEGLSLTRDERYLPLLERVAAKVVSPESSLRLAGARFRCGDELMGEVILSALQDEETAPALRLWAIGFAAENRMQDAVPVLAQIAVESSSEELAEAALRALIEASGYATPPPAEKLVLEEEPAEGAQEQAATAADAALRPRAPEERRKLVSVIMEWRRRELETPPTKSLPERSQEAAPR